MICRKPNEVSFNGMIITIEISVKEGDMFSILRRGCLHMAKELELAKKLAVLGWIFRKRLITEDEYSRTRIHIMNYSVGSSRNDVTANLFYTDRF